MKKQTFNRALLGTSSVLALSAAAMISAAAPAQAQAISEGIYGGGSTLASQAMRQLFNCYAGITVGGDGFSFSAGFDNTVPTPGLLPNSCKSVFKKVPVQGMYAAVGSGSGRRGYFSDDARQLLLNSANIPNPIPPFVDSNNANFGTYPYPRIDFGASDANLNPAGIASLNTGSFTSFNPTTNWQTLAATAVIPTGSTVVVTYSTANLGNPIQLPLFEVGVALGVNNAGMTIQSGITSGAGSAIQLSTAQVCAIFSGLVKDWSATGNITFLDNNGTKQSQSFFSSNVSPTAFTAVPYSATSLPIHVVFRSDGSGTTFILTQYLHSVCPQLNDGTNGYDAIFGNTTLPTDTFTKFTAIVNTVRGTTTATSDWIGAGGTADVAINIGNASDHPERGGHIGYLSNDFASPYSATVTGTTEGPNAAPASAAVQNEQLRTRGFYNPRPNTPFIAPTPAAIDLGWSSIDTPASGGSYATFNVYAQTYPTGTSSGSIDISGKSKMGLPLARNAYPIVGTAFGLFYSCYANNIDASRVTNIKNYLAWHFGGSDQNITTTYTNANGFTNPGRDKNVGKVIENNGFHELGSDLAHRILTEYVTSGAVQEIGTAGSGLPGCSIVTGTGALD